MSSGPGSARAASTACTGAAASNTLSATGVSLRRNDNSARRSARAAATLRSCARRCFATATSTPVTATSATAISAATVRRTHRRSSNDISRAPRHAGMVSVFAADVRRFLNLEQELVVVLGLLHLVEEQFERLLRLERVQHPAQLPHDLQFVRREQDLFLAGTGRVDIDRREDPLVREPAVELELHVAGALELLEDDLVHPRAGVDQRGREDRQRAAVLDVARGTEEPLRRVQRGAVDTTGEDATARRRG